MILRIPKTTLLVLLLAIILVLAAFFLLFLQLRQSPETQEQLLPTPTPNFNRPAQNASPIEPVSISPAEDPTGETIQNPSQAISYALSEEVSPDDVRVQVSPPLPVKVQQGNTPSSIIVVPDPPDFWKPDVLYTITLLDAQGRTITRYSIRVPRVKFPEIVD